jgi:dTMP kinase
LMFAARAQHIANLIKPTLAAGKWVVSDRFVDSSYAYQGAGRGLDLKQIEMLDHYVVGDMRPDATILLDAPPALGLARASSRQNKDRIEQEQIEFFERVREAFFLRAKQDPTRFYIINALKPLYAVHEEIGIIMDEIIASKQVVK